MAANLVSLVMQFLTPDMIGRIAAALGLDHNKVGSAITSAVPALLAALSNTATQPGGAQKLADAAKQQTSTLGNLASVLAGGGGSSLVEKGSQMLASFVGGPNQNALTDAISRFTGLGQNASGSLLGMLAPIVMGTIAQHQGSAHGLNANSIANLFATQKDNIANALPSGLSSLLSGTGLLNSLGDATRTATAASTEAMREASATRPVDVARQRGASAASAPSNWLYWLLPLAAAAALLIYFAVRPTEEVAQQGMSKVQNAAVEAPDLGKQINNSITSLRTTLDGVTDVASAKAALPKVQEAASQIDKSGGEVGQLSADQRKLVAGLISPLMPAFNQLCDKVLAIPGVAEVLKPSVDAVKAKLTTLIA
jgi:hypothetical protein